MKKNVIFAVLMFLSLCTFSQKSSPEKPFTFKIEGTIRNFSEKKIFLHHKWDDKDYTDSAKVVSGKFSFNIKSAEPNMYWFSLTNTISDPVNCTFFIDPTTIKATLIGDSLGYSQIVGGQNQVDFLEYRAIINNLILLQRKMQEDYTIATQNGDVNTQNAIQQEYQNLNGQYINSLKTFVKSHPKSNVSAYILFSDFNNPNIPIDDAAETIGYIDKSLEKSKFIQIANKRIDDKRGTSVGFKATNFSQPTPDGKNVSLADFKGKYVLVDFWASWCRPCRMENPNVVLAYNRFKDKGFTVLGVSLDSKKEAWVAAIEQDQLTWTHISDLKGWGNEVGRLYNVTGIPQNFLIDRDGKIVAKDLRGQALDEKLNELLK